MNDQKCSKCKIIQPLDNFHSGNKKNGKSSWCKRCDAKRHIDYANKPGIKERLYTSEYNRRRKKPEYMLWKGTRNRCRRSNIPFNLTVEDCVIPDVCPALGIPLVSGQFRPRGTMLAFNAPSLDRINPELGYIKGNVAVISWRANHLKNNATADELEAITKYIRERS